MPEVCQQRPVPGHVPDLQLRLFELSAVSSAALRPTKLAALCLAMCLRVRRTPESGDDWSQDP